MADGASEPWISRVSGLLRGNTRTSLFANSTPRQLTVTAPRKVLPVFSRPPLPTTELLANFFQCVAPLQAMEPTATKNVALFAQLLTPEDAENAGPFTEHPFIQSSQRTLRLNS